MENKRTKKVVAKNPIEQILDENNTDNIVLFDDQQNPITFEQVALIPLDRTNALYAILIPITPMQGVNEGEGVLFEVDEQKQSLEVVNDQQIINEVLEVYQALLDEGEDKGNK